MGLLWLLRAVQVNNVEISHLCKPSESESDLAVVCFFLLQVGLRSRVFWSRWIWRPPSLWVWGYPSLRTAWAVWFRPCLRICHSEISYASFSLMDISSAVSCRTTTQTFTRVSTPLTHCSQCTDLILSSVKEGCGLLFWFWHLSLLVVWDEIQFSLRVSWSSDIRAWVLVQK